MSKLIILKKSIILLIILFVVTSVFALFGAVCAEDVAYYSVTCEKCKEVIQKTPAVDLHSESTSGPSYTNGTFKVNPGNSKLVYNFPEEIIGTDKAPYKLEMTFKLETVGSDKNKLYNSGNGRNLLKFTSSDFSFLRQYPVSDGKGGYLSDTIFIGSMVDFGVDPVSLTQIKVGESVKFEFYITPAKHRADIYVNGKYVTTREGTDIMSSLSETIQFGDGNAPGCHYIVSDIHILRPDPKLTDEAVWTDKVVYGVNATDKTLESTVECSCGEKLFAQSVSKALTVTDNIYYGQGTVKNIPTEGEFWFATDYNIRTAEALEAVKATEADIVFGDLKIAIDRTKISAPETYQIALKVSYPENSITANAMLWIDGKLVKTYEDVVLSDRITLGSLETTDVRFNYTKVAEISEKAAEIKYNDTADDQLIPCIHGTDGFLTEINKAESGELTCVYECIYCGELLYSEPVVDYHSEADSGLSYNNGAFSFSAGGSKWSYILPEEIVGVDKEPYQIEMTVNLTAVGSDKNKLYNSGNGRNLLKFTSSDFSFLRQYPVSDGKGGYLSDTIFIGSMVDFGVDPVSLTQIKVGESVKFEFYITPAKHRADIYVNGKYVTTREGTDIMSSLSETMQFGDGNAPGCNYTISNIHILRPADTHTHSDKWFSGKEKLESPIVNVDHKKLVYSYMCYCGEIVSNNEIVENLVVADNVYYGNGVIESIPTEGEFWIATDYNIRTAEALEAVKATEADIVFGDLKIAIDRTKISAPETYQLALRVTYPEGADKADVTLYVNGEYAESFEAQTLSDTLKLGTLERNDIRFGYTKVVELGDNDSVLEATYTDSVDKDLRPCAHLMNQPRIDCTVDGQGNLYYSGKCDKCGEIVYNISVKDLHNDASCGLNCTDGAFSFSAGGSKWSYILPEEIVGIDKEPYQIEMTVKLTAVGSDKDKLFNLGSGRNLLKFTSSDYSLLRQYPVSDGNGGYLSDTIFIGSMINFGVDPVPLTQIKVGESVKFEFYITPAKHRADIYVNGKYVTTREGTDIMSSLSETIQFGDGNAPGCNYTVSDIHIYTLDDNHTHSDKWLTAEEKAATTIVVGEDNTVTYEYDCYCGERASEGIESVVVDEIAPVYGSTEKYVAVTAPEFEGEAIFAGRVMAKALPAEGTKALVSVGTNAVLSVDNTGLLYVNGTASETTLTVGEYLGFAVVLSADGYSVYFDGKYLGEDELDGFGDIAVGSEGMGKFHFEAMALVTLSADGDEKYFVVTDSHSHSFDPYTAELILNAEKTTISVEYVCTICDNPAIDGITEDLYDNEATDEIETISAVIGTPIDGAVIVDTVGEYTADTDTYWFSADFKVNEFSNKNRQPIVSLGANGIVLIDANGTLRLANEVTTVIGSVKKEGSFNITFGVQKGETSLVHVYLDGKYCGTLEHTLDGTENIKVGSTGSLEVTNIKLCEIGNGGLRAIGAFSCQVHTFAASKAVISYLDLDTFAVKNRCLVCGHTITERPAYNNYVGATVPIYDHGNVELPLNEADFSAELDTSYRGHWIVVDVNIQESLYDIGNFYGFKNLIGSNGNSLVLINQRGKLMLGNGKELGSIYLFASGKTTKNFALEYVFADTDNSPETDDGYINVYIDGKYVGSFAVADVKYTYEHTSVSYEEFGAEELENIKFYNIRSFVSCAEGEFIGFTYAEDESVIPCAHIFDTSYMTKTAVFGEKIQIVYSCNKCGERVHKVFDKNLYDTSLNSKFVFDENGELTISTTTDLVSSPDIIGTDGAKYWLKFKLDVNELNVDAVSANDNNNGKGRILLNFNTNNNSPLRLFGVYDYKTRQYRSDCLSVRNNANSYASEIVRIYEGQSYEFALYVDPAQKSVEIYLNGKYVTTRYNATYANGTNIRFLDGNWGTFTISDFSFVTGDNIDHIHTAEYSEALGMTPVVEYGDITLVHKFICNCGKTIEAGIDTVMGYELQNMENVTAATPIAEATNGKVNRTPYWVSAKVYGDGSKATVYSYNGTELVGIENGYYTVGGVATDIPVSHTVTPGDYDLISLNVIPTYDKAVVYINGFEAGAVNTEFADSEKFNILLGGGAELDFKFIKAATLADGVNNEIDIADCGEHKFAYRPGIIAEITEDGVDYKCKYCNGVVKSIALGEGGIIAEETLSVSGKAKDVAEGRDFYERVMKTGDSGSIWISFKASSDNLSKQKDDETFLKFQINNDHGIYIRLFKVDNDTVRYEFLGSSSDSAPIGDSLLENGEKYTFVIEHDPISRQYYVYVNGDYKGGNSFKLDYGESATYKLYVGSSASWNISDFRVYNPSVEENKEVVIENEEITYPHNHFPDVNKKESISVENGVIVQKFTCTCGKEVELSVMHTIGKNSNKTDFASIYSDAKYDVFDGINYGEGTYVVSFDFKPKSLNIPISGEEGVWLVFFYEPSTKRDLAILSAYLHPYEEGKGYTDKNGDGYADGVYDLRSKSGINSGNPVLATVKAGDSVNFTYVIDPTSRNMAVYVNGEYKHLRQEFGKFTTDDVYLRFKATGYGHLGYDNLKIVRMSDECNHVAPACAEGVYKTNCELCGKTVAPTHNYTKEFDRKYQWTKYTCETCGAFHIEFNNLSRLKDMKFINENEFISYLSKDYCPVFEKAE